MFYKLCTSRGKAKFLLKGKGKFITKNAAFENRKNWRKFQKILEKFQNCLKEPKYLVAF